MRAARVGAMVATLATCENRPIEKIAVPSATTAVMRRQRHAQQRAEGDQDDDGRSDQTDGLAVGGLACGGLLDGLATDGDLETRSAGRLGQRDHALDVLPGSSAASFVKTIVA